MYNQGKPILNEIIEMGEMDMDLLNGQLRVIPQERRPGNLSVISNKKNLRNNKNASEMSRPRGKLLSYSIAHI
jgi:hypothetical protein